MTGFTDESLTHHHPTTENPWELFCCGLSIRGWYPWLVARVPRITTIHPSSSTVPLLHSRTPSICPHFSSLLLIITAQDFPRHGTPKFSIPMASNTSAVTDSPSLRTRSRTSIQLAPPSPPILLTTSAPPGASEPTKKRGKGKKVTITNQTDEQIWDLTDEAIVGKFWTFGTQGIPNHLTM